MGARQCRMSAKQLPERRARAQLRGASVVTVAQNQHGATLPRLLPRRCRCATGSADRGTHADRRSLRRPPLTLAAAGARAARARPRGHPHRPARPRHDVRPAGARGARCGWAARPRSASGPPWRRPAARRSTGTRSSCRCGARRSRTSRPSAASRRARRSGPRPPARRRSPGRSRSVRPVSATSSAISTRASLEVDELGHGRQDHRQVQALVDAGVELDVHRAGVLHPERVAERAGDEQAAAGDGEDHVGPLAVGVHGLGERPRRWADLGPLEDLAIAHAAEHSRCADRNETGSPPDTNVLKPTGEGTHAQADEAGGARGGDGGPRGPGERRRDGRRRSVEGLRRGRSPGASTSTSRTRSRRTCRCGRASAPSMFRPAVEPGDRPAVHVRRTTASRRRPTRSRPTSSARSSTRPRTGRPSTRASTSCRRPTRSARWS